MSSIFCRLRNIKDKVTTNLGDWNVFVRTSHDRKRVCVNVHGKNDTNKNDSFHFAFNLDRMKELYFRVRFELEGLFDTVALEKDYWAWYKERTKEPESQEDAA